MHLYSETQMMIYQVRLRNEILLGQFDFPNFFIDMVFFNRQIDLVKMGIQTMSLWHRNYSSGILDRFCTTV